MKVSFIDFWTGFDPNNNFFIHLLKSFKENIQISQPNNTDLIIYSCFGNGHKKYDYCKKIFFTGENIRPNFNECNYSVSFDFDSYNQRNVRIPLWYLYIDWFNVGSYGSPGWLVPVSHLTQPSEFTQKEKNKFACAVYGNPKRARTAAVEKINSYKDIDCYGRIHQLSLPEGEKYKMDTVSEYKFSLCFENSLYPGYFTEKLLHAKIASGVPLYASDLSFDKDFNPKCCLQLLNYQNLDHYLEHIIELDQNETKYKQIIQEPLFNKMPELSDLFKQIEPIL